MSGGGLHAKVAMQSVGPGLIVKASRHKFFNGQTSETNWAIPKYLVKKI